MDNKATKKAQQTHPKNNIEKGCLKNVLWGSFGAVLGSPWAAFFTSDGNFPGRNRGWVGPGKGREGGKPPSQRDVGDVGRRMREVLYLKRPRPQKWAGGLKLGGSRPPRTPRLKSLRSVMALACRILMDLTRMCARAGLADSNRGNVHCFLFFRFGGVKIAIWGSKSLKSSVPV